MYVRGVPETKKSKWNWDTIWGESGLKVFRTDGRHNPRIQETHTISTRNLKKYCRHAIVILKKRKSKEKKLNEAERNKKEITFKWVPFTWRVDFSTATIKARKKVRW